MKIRIILITIIVALAIGLFFAIHKKRGGVPVPVTPAVIETSRGDLITIQPKAISVAEDTYLYGIGGSYPQFPQADAAFNVKIAKTFTDEIAEFKKNADDDYQARLKTGGDAFQKEFAQGDVYTYELKTTVVQSNERYISVIVRQEGFSGGAHGYHVATTFNYDVANKKELPLTDFISLADASKAARASLKKTFTERGDAGTFTTFAMGGTDPAAPDNFRNFTLANDMITLYFNEYQVAPYVYGEQSVTIPRS